MGSPRRSARSRQPSSQHPSHSSSSSSSSRRSRHHDHDSHQDLDRGHGASEFHHEPDSPSANNDEAIDGGDTEDEITRCICGYQEYQGGDDDQSDTDGLFIQCDQCSVWQHGFCVGITNSSATPDNYYCEQCKPEMHKLGHSKAGMPISTYLLAQAEPPKPIHSKEATHKRRTTMNSRDAEYEEEMLQRMLEISKQETKVGDSTRGTNGRSRKRGSSQGSDEPQESKRPRTSKSPEENATVDSGDDKNARASAAPAPKRSRATANRNSSNTTSTTKRTSTRNKNSDKHESKKDDSEHSDEYAPRKNNRSTHKTEESNSVPATSEQGPDTPQQPVKRTGRNQYTNGTATRRRTNNRHTRQSEDPNDSNVASPMAMTRDHSSTGHKHDPAALIEKPTRPRIPQARMSLNEMKKRVSSISEYITRTQVEMANMGERDVYAYLAYLEDKGSPLSSTTPRSNGSASDTPTSAPNVSLNEKPVPSIQVNGGAATGNMLAKASDILSSSFATGAVDMMEQLSTKINRWQQQYGEKI